MSQHPQLTAQVDFKAATEAYDVIERFLIGVDVKDRRRGQVIEIIGSIVFGLMVLALGIVLVLNWRGFL